MPIEESILVKMIKEAFPDAVITITSLSNDDDHYSANIVSSRFEGKTRVEQHKMVYDALQGKVGTELHALALQTSSPTNR